MRNVFERWMGKGKQETVDLTAPETDQAKIDAVRTELIQKLGAGDDSTWEKLDQALTANSDVAGSLSAEELKIVADQRDMERAAAAAQRPTTH